MSETTENIQSQITGKFNEFITNNPNGGKIAMVIGAIVLLVVGVSIIQWAIRSYRAWKQSKVWLLKGTKSAKKGAVLNQNLIQELSDSEGTSNILQNKSLYNKAVEIANNPQEMELFQKQ